MQFPPQGSISYTYDSANQLPQMTHNGADGRYTMDFRYDANGTPLSVYFTHIAYWDGGMYTCCDEVYYYITNLQGDVIAIVDCWGDTYATYTYDAWGRPLSAQSGGCIGDVNPLRYRGYVYDIETGFYYLQSRYYDPVKGRFISPDAFLSTGQGILGHNMFAYCNNNPVNLIDSSGHLPMRKDQVFINDGARATTGQIFAQKLSNFLYDIKNTIYNTDEKTVLQSDSISFYNGVPVFRAPIGTAALSYGGIIVLGDELRNTTFGINTLKHEYGHYLHMKEIGIDSFTLTVAIPSLVGAALDSADLLPVYYYDQPWEYIADMYGQVNRGRYAPNASKIARLHHRFTKIVSTILRLV